MEALRLEPKRLSEQFEYSMAVADMQHLEETNALQRLLSIAQAGHESAVKSLRLKEQERKGVVRELRLTP